MTRTALERLKARVPGIRDDLAADLLDEAEHAVLAYTNRTKLPDDMIAAKIKLALIYYNREGMEGETARSQGGVSQTFDAEGLPKEIKDMLRPRRLARAGWAR